MSLGLGLSLTSSRSVLGGSSDATVIVSVSNLRNTKGSLGCRLFSSEKGFPRNPEGTVRQQVRVTNGVTRCVYKGVQPGTYALTVIHDENDNGKLDMNLLGMPLEGYGVSNNRTYATRAPVWSECKFAAEPGKSRELEVELRY